MSYPDPASQTPPRAPARVVIARATALLCLGAISLESVADIVPDESIFWIVTPTRSIIAIGLLAVLCTGESRWRTPADIPLALLVVSSAVANYLAGQPWSTWRGLVTIVAVYYLAVGVRRVVPDSWPAIALLALACTTIASIVALQQVVQDTPTGFCRGSLDGSHDICGADTMIRAVGTFSNPNLLATYLVLLLPVAAAASASLANMRAQLVSVGLVVLGYLAVVLTGSRGGVVAALAGLVVFAFLRRLRPGKHAMAERWVPWLLPIGATIAAAVAFVVVITRGKVGVRADVWTAAVEIAVHHPLGVGPGRAGAWLNQMIDSPEEFHHTHNLWLNYAVESGIGGLLAVVALTVIGAWIAVTGSAAGSLTAPAAAAGMCGFLAISLADHPANHQRIAYAAIAMLAILIVDQARREPDRVAIDAQPFRAVSLFDETMPLPRNILASMPAHLMPPQPGPRANAPRRNPRPRRDTPPTGPRAQQALRRDREADHPGDRWDPGVGSWVNETSARRGVIDAGGQANQGIRPGDRAGPA
ncbi:O-antigen ligase family protein [Nocardia alba]|uniref:O-antigen ligase-like membrane protein n=1 Tax=Nocardia alba TaxID=225051 RepID=A0A4R1G7P8_9NOCA|nr:O-antigen ligase family protein [Nocardia alba]TCJ99941.1 O-antigen ligase-like membrane protein [Nocardia alba]